MMVRRAPSLCDVGGLESNVMRCLRIFWIGTVISSAILERCLLDYLQERHLALCGCPFLATSCEILKMVKTQINIPDHGHRYIIN